jgi:pyruvate/2-oxoglutarate dehydrogenase complex dihydrolipoamide acyltransferase (E2) component
MPDIEGMNRALLSRMEEELTAELGERKKERKGLRATPAARRLARERGVALEEVKEKLGVEGLVREEHVRRFLEAG